MKQRVKVQLVRKRQNSKNSNSTICLGKWCEQYPNEDCTDVLTYHWDDREKLYNDFCYLQDLNDSIISDIATVLNNIHKVDKSKRYWEMVVGYWLNVYTSVLYDRWCTVHKLLETHDADEIDVCGFISNDLSSNSIEDFVGNVLEDEWNESIYLLILEYLKSEEYFFERYDSGTLNKGSNKFTIRYCVREALNWLSSLAGRKDDVFLVATYMPDSIVSKIYLKLGQLPRYWFDGHIPAFHYNKEMRQWSIEKKAIRTEFENFALSLLPHLMPRSFLEGYEPCHKKIVTRRWPTNPKAIFTSSKHFNSEIFLYWAANKKEKGARLITGEHGGFGVGKFNGAVSYQMKITDHFISTGWIERSVVTTPVGNFRLAGRKCINNNSGYALMVNVAMPRYSFDLRSMIVAGQMLDYFDDQFDFVSTLPSYIRDNLVVRLYPEDYGWRQSERWHDRFPRVAIDNMTNDIWESIKHSRVVVCTYNATVYIDCISANIPVIIFWDPECWEVNDDAKQIFSELEKVGVYHENPQNAAKQLRLVWGNVNDWWNGDEVQRVIMQFKAKYCSDPTNLIENTVSIMRDEVALSSYN